jgi:hypothetical protein
MASQSAGTAVHMHPDDRANSEALPEDRARTSAAPVARVGLAVPRIHVPPAAVEASVAPRRATACGADELAREATAHPRGANARREVIAVRREGHRATVLGRGRRRIGRCGREQKQCEQDRQYGTRERSGGRRGRCANRQSRLPRPVGGRLEESGSWSCRDFSLHSYRLSSRAFSGQGSGVTEERAHGPHFCLVGRRPDSVCCGERETATVIPRQRGRCDRPDHRHRPAPPDRRAGARHQLALCREDPRRDYAGMPPT